MNFETNKDKGRVGLAMAIAYFGCNGYTVSIPLDDTQKYDLVVEKEGVFKSIQCKATGNQHKYGRFDLALRSTGGTNGSVYSRLTDTNVDLLFAITSEGTMYLIPIKDIPDINTLALKKEKSKFAKKDTFDTSRYIIQI